MVDDDKKKDLDSEYSALSDALDSGDPAPSLEDLLKDHGIDLGSDMDLDAMQDFSFSEQAEDKSTPNKSLDDFLTAPDKSKDLDLFSENLFDDHLFDEPAPPIAPAARPTRAAPPMDEPIEPPMDSMDFMDSTEPNVDDTTIFETSDFDDVNSNGDVDLGSDPLFDYDPQAEATFADVGGAEPDMGGDDGGMGMPPPEKGPGAKRIFVRLGMMLVLVSVIYGGLRLFLGEKPTQTVAEAPEAKIPPSQIAKLSMPEQATPAPTTPPVTAAAPQAAPVTETTSPMPSSLPVPGAVSSGLPQTTPVVTAATTPSTAPADTSAAEPATPTAPTTTVAAAPTVDSNASMMHDAVASPATSLDVAVPIAAMISEKPAAAPSTATPSATTTTTATAPAAAPSKITMGSGDVNDKLDNLELALQAIDQRLAQVSAGGVGDEKVQRLERLVNDSSAPEMQDVLKQAVNKMRELDRKLERISELQQQVRMLNTDVKMLKEDVETQTNMVGEQQRLFNDNVQLAQMAEPGPVKMMVQAAIPGRAWLRSERGELLTVIPGDEVPGYGRVVSIDAASGTVVTSSRAVFREQ